MEWMMLPLRRYADFSGRSRRMEYWMFMLGVFAMYFVLTLVALLLIGVTARSQGDGPQNATAVGSSLVIFGVATLLGFALLIPTLAVQVRRFHDQGLSGWMVLIGLIPLGGLVVLVFMCLRGTPGPNRYGADPVGDTRAAMALPPTY